LWSSHLLLAHSFDKEASVVIVDGKCHGSSEEKWKLIETVKTKVTILFSD
jgi:6-phosphogluconate dehydrogenase (decarboxylating)